MNLLGVDFTSAPRPGKPITVARGRLRAGPGQALRRGTAAARAAPSRGRRSVVAQVSLHAVDALCTFDAFEQLLAEPGPWVGGFDFPFGLPRETVLWHGWPPQWRALALHCFALGRATFRAALDRERETRPVGRRYTHRAGDALAGAHPAVKLVNPPVALMFIEGASRLARSGVHVPALADGDRSRVAVEAYPGYVVRSITGESYKSDDRRKQTAARAHARSRIVAALASGEHCLGLRAELSPLLAARAVDDASGDTLDAIVCAVQAGWAALREGAGWGLPVGVDPVEGWIAGVPGAAP